MLLPDPFADLASPSTTEPPPPRTRVVAPLDVPSDHEPLFVHNWAELFDTTTVPEAYVDGLVLPGRWTSLVAPAKAGKSTLALHIALALSRGRDPFTGASTDPLPVLYLDAEMGRLDVYERLVALSLTPDDLTGLHYTDAPPKCDDVPGAAAVVSYANRHGVAVVVLDGLNGFVSGTENNDEPWRKLFDLTIGPLKRLGAAIISTDNSGRDVTRGGRGSTVKMDKPDAVIELTRTDNGVRLKATHRRTYGIGAELLLTMRGTDGDEPITYAIAHDSWPAGTADAAALLDRLGIPTDYGRERVRTALREAGEGVRDSVLSAAIRYRKTVGNRSGNRSPGTGPVPK